MELTFKYRQHALNVQLVEKTGNLKGLRNGNLHGARVPFASENVPLGAAAVLGLPGAERTALEASRHFIDAC